MSIFNQVTLQASETFETRRDFVLLLVLYLVALFALITSFIDLSEREAVTAIGCSQTDSDCEARPPHSHRGGTR